MLLRDLGDEVNFIAKGINYYLGVIKFFNHWRGVCKQGSAVATYRKSELLATVRVEWHEYANLFRSSTC